MRCFAIDETFGPRLLAHLARRFRVIGPVSDGQGGSRLDGVAAWSELLPGALSRLPAKKFLLPSSEPLWSWDGTDFKAAAEADLPLVLLGLPVCEFKAIAYLDRVFSDDPGYQRRRAGLLRIAATCEATPDCFCSARELPAACDLLLSGRTVWAFSPAGSRLLEQLPVGGEVPSATPLWITGEVGPEPEPVTGLPPSGEFWDTHAASCLGCGACSAVCPTCYCYAMLDRFEADGSCTRVRRWDNCFFPQHARVAGGGDFRPSRGERLRFRAEHKLLGFEPLRGETSCVGCGRCRQVCPVKIDLAEIACRARQEVSHAP